ncbi:hypothetical protein MUO56_03335 [Candidatus Bathyarchaeota archaeon]|jgi:hypothetical protein|nr:hypothetical protein [Candidatus Bathyarchaeota archaeon]
MSQIDLDKLSPRARDLLDIFAKTSGVADLATVIQDETFSIFELMKLIDTTRDPKIYPQDAVLVFNTVKAVLAKFSRFGQPTKLADHEPK